MLLKRILLESLNDIYIVTRCPLPRWQMIWGCCRFFFPHHRIRLIRDLTMDKPVNRRVYCNRHEQLPIPEHLSSLLIYREFVLFMCICKFLCFVSFCLLLFISVFPGFVFCPQILFIDFPLRFFYFLLPSSYN
jgi:hypothetical protein